MQGSPGDDSFAMVASAQHPEIRTSVWALVFEQLPASVI